MKFPLSWLHAHLETDADLETIAEKLTALGLEVEEVVNPAEQLKGFVVGHVVTAEKHPDADKLQCLTVDTGQEKLAVVCGAANARAGMKGVFAPAGSYIPGLDVTLKKTKIRGQDSNGMMCSGKELLLSDDHEGIIELPDSAETGSPAARALGIDDPVIDISLTPNRGDCAGVYGIARDLAAAGCGKLRPLDTAPVAGTDAAPVDIIVEDSTACPLFIGRFVSGVRNGSSPETVIRRLEAAGQRAIDALVDVTNEMAIGYNRPLHVFDADKIKGALRVRRSQAGETFAALNDKTYTLDEGMIVLADDSGVIGLAGVIGGTSTAVGPETTNILIECAAFDSVAIARAGQALQIDSEAQYRFARGIDLAFMPDAIEIATRNVIDRCGGTAGKVITVGTLPEPRPEIAYTPARLQRLAGLDLAPETQATILASLGFAVDRHDEHWTVTPPSWRHDIDGSADLVEEILRVAGYDRIPATPLRPPHGAIRARTDDLTRRGFLARACLVGRGILETVTWSFLSESRAALFDIGSNKKSLTITNPISSDLAVMRPSLLPNLIEAAGRNADRGLEDAALFEIGALYESAEKDGQIMTATLLRSGHARPRHWSAPARTADVFDAKADAYAVLEACGVNTAGLQLTADAPGFYHPGRSGQLRLGKTVVARFGMIHPATLVRMGRDEAEAMAAAEVFLTRLPPIKSKGPQKELLRPAPLQPVRRDFAFLAPEDLAAAQLVRALSSVDKTLVTNVDIFDVYQGKGVAEGQKSIALSVTLQPHEKTLTDADLAGISDKIVAAAEKVGAKLRA